MGSGHLTLRSFKPVVDKRSRVLILGTMPGPVALARREYYGFPSNHFWRIISELCGVRGPLSYPQKIRLLQKNRIALWDTIQSCERVGASDGAIKKVVPNDIVGLVRRYPNIRVIFLNGKFAQKLYEKYSDGKIQLPVCVLPSTSPANATVGFRKKLQSWSVVNQPIRPPTRGAARSS